MTLDLYQSPTQTQSCDLSSKPQDDLFSLQYILDGTGQLLKRRGQNEDVQPGDSILAPHGHTSIQVQQKGQQANGADQESEWHMASLTLLLPKDPLASKSLDNGGLDALQPSAAQPEGAERFMTEEEAARIVAGAREIAQAAGQYQELQRAPLDQGGSDSELQLTHRQSDSNLESLAFDGQSAVTGSAKRFLEQRKDPVAGPRADAAEVSENTGSEAHLAETRQSDAGATDAEQQSNSVSGKTEAQTLKGFLERMYEGQAAESPQAANQNMESQSSEIRELTPGTIDDEASEASDATASQARNIAETADARSPSDGGVSPAAAQLLTPNESSEIESKEAESRRNAMVSVKAFLSKLARWRQSATLGKSPVMKRSLNELNAFRLPDQTNRLALIYDPLGDHVNFTFGVEIFEPGHKTNPHLHQHAHELFFILAGEGEGFCDEERFPLSAGDVVVFPPGSTHGIDVDESGKMYCLEIMQPNDMFAELVRAGMPAGSLLDDDLCILIASGCG